MNKSDDMISRQAAINGKISIQRTNGVEMYSDDVVPVTYLENLPPAQPERKRGSWKRITEGRTPELYICPFCHRTIEDEGIECMVAMRYPFCHCGADMREGRKDER